MWVIRTFIRNLAKKFPIFRKLLRFCIFSFGKFKYGRISKKNKTEDKTVVFASFNGHSFSDSPKAIFNYLKNSEEFKDHRFVWGFAKPEKFSFLKDENTSVLNIKSKEFLKETAKAKYWIFNYKIPEYMFPKKEQIFLQCWHGTPLKRLGCDLEHFDNAMNTVSEIAKRYKIETSKFSYFLSPSAFASEKFLSAWNMKAQGKEDIILEVGYPRNDFLTNYKETDVTRIKKDLNLPNDKKVILYAPTYRDNQHSTKSGYIFKNEIDFDILKEKLSEEYIILFRAHYFIANSFDFNKYEGFLYDVSGYDDISELYVISDMLITDYSSVFFDYANLKRPIIFYMYDLEKYRDELRGFYFGLEELPGNIVKTEAELIEEIGKAREFTFNEKYKSFNDKFNYLDDGNATKRVVAEVFSKCKK